MAAIAVHPLRAGGAAPDAARGSAGEAALGKLEESAAQGDAEAMFRLAQAYRFGRNVPVNLERAESLYARAATAGHAAAADAYGLMLFEAGRREAAMPYLRDAAGRGDPRAQYLLGIAYFNGDFVEVDWLRAYALMTLAKASGLPQAASALAQMDGSLPPAQRSEGAALAEQLRAGFAAARDTPVASAAPASTAPAGGEEQASQSDWRIQLGAFSIPANADALWNRLADRAELQGSRRIRKVSGRLTLLQAGGFPSRGAAAAACSVLKRSGHDCLVVGS
jgi:TPR repeat protein